MPQERAAKNKTLQTMPKHCEEQEQQGSQETSLSAFFVQSCFADLHIKGYPQWISDLRRTRARPLLKVSLPALAAHYVQALQNLQEKTKTERQGTYAHALLITRPTKPTEAAAEQQHAEAAAAAVVVGGLPP